MIFSVVRSLKNGKLCETAEKELLLSALLEPRPGCFRTHVPTPQEYEPDVGVKEIQCVHRSVRWSHPTFGPSETISGNFTLFGQRPLACSRTVLTPARINSRTERPWQRLVVSASGRGEWGISTVVRTESRFINRVTTTDAINMEIWVRFKQQAAAWVGPFTSLKYSYEKAGRRAPRP
jgi:hypothetical protein